MGTVHHERELVGEYTQPAGRRAPNPLPCTQGRGQGEGSDAPIGEVRPLAHRCPLTPTLSPEYRGKGESSRPTADDEDIFKLEHVS